MKPKKLELKSKMPGARELNTSQKLAYPTSPQKPSDATGDNKVPYKIGTLPKGGFQAVFSFGNTSSTKTNVPKKPGAKIY